LPIAPIEDEGIITDVEEVEEENPQRG
jgi:hypothetical protein